MKVIFIVLTLFATLNIGLIAQNEDAINHFNSAVELVKKKDYEGSISEYSKAIKLDPQYVKALYNRGNAFMALKEYPQAIKDYKKALKYNDKHAKAHYYLAYCQMQMKDNDGALISFTRALKYDDSLIKAHYYRGYIQMIGKNYTKAIEDFDGTLKLDNTYFKAAYNKALCHYALDEFIDAANAFTLSIEIDPDYYEAYEKRALVFKKLNKVKLALRDYNYLIEVNPEANYYYNIGLIHEDKEDHNLAMQAYMNALSLDRSHIKSAKKKAVLSTKLKDYENGAIDFERLANLEPDNPEHHYNAGLCNIQNKNYQQAILNLSACIQLNDAHAKAYYNRASVYSSMNDLENACLDIRKSAELGFDDAFNYVRSFCQ